MYFWDEVLNDHPTTHVTQEGGVKNMATKPLFSLGDPHSLGGALVYFMPFGKLLFCPCHFGGRQRISCFVCLGLSIGQRSVKLST